MTKSNPMEAYRRQKRKKEIEKNKKSRISARDEMVKNTKTASEITKQIKQLEKRGGVPNHAETMKLQRLKKELKLVAEASKDRVAQISTQAKPLTELDDPRKSVYFEEKMNPFGAPPPGKPRLYHRRGGGTTMNINEAVVPGQEEEARREQLKEQPQFIQAYGQNAIVEDTNLRQPHDKQRIIPPPPPPLQEVRQIGNPRQRQHISHRPPPPPPPPPRQIQPPPPPPRTNDPPALPTPSSAVARNRKRKLAADIWASTEEVQYERERGLDLEEGVELVKNEWYYKDSFQNLQGPYPANQMQQWAAAGYFPIQTMVRKGASGKFIPMGNVNFETSHQVSVREPATDDSNIQARIDALRQKNDVPDDEELIQSRIEALRQHDQQSKNDENSVEARIEALRRQHQVGRNDTAHVEVPQGDDQTNKQIDDMVAESKDNVLHHEASVDLSKLRQASVDEKHLNGQFQPESEINDVEDGKGRQDSHPVLNGDVTVEESQRDLVENKYSLSSEIPPPYPLVDDGSVPTYPVDMDEGPLPYPVDDDAHYAVADYYPISNEDLSAEDFSYPVVGTYPVDADDEGYPVDDLEANPIPPNGHDSIRNLETDKASEQKPEKKVVKVDQEIVGFMPSHLQKRRLVHKAKSTTPKAVKKARPPPNKSVGDDYDTFMNEISNL